MQRVHLFRHGQTDWNQLGRFQGQSDIELNAKGREQARDLLPYFRGHPVQTFLSSDLSRAEETARILADELQLELQTEARLREIHFGEAEGLTSAEIQGRWGTQAMQAFYSVEPEADDFRFPGGESKLEAMNRALLGIEEFLQRTGHAAIGVACHGGIIRRVLKELAPRASRPERIHNGDVFELVHSPSGWSWQFE